MFQHESLLFIYLLIHSGWSLAWIFMKERVEGAYRLIRSNMVWHNPHLMKYFSEYPHQRPTHWEMRKKKCLGCLLFKAMLSIGANSLCILPSAITNLIMFYAVTISCSTHPFLGSAAKCVHFLWMPDFARTYRFYPGRGLVHLPNRIYLP